MEANKFIITINREYGSGGREIAMKIGEKLGLKVYDKAALDGLIAKFGLTETEIEKIKSVKPSWWDDFCDFYRPFPSIVPSMEENKKVTSRQLYHAEAKILRDIAVKESCIIVGRSGFHIFKGEKNVSKLFIIAEEEHRVHRIMERLGVDENEARQQIEEVDTARENYTRSFAGVSRYDARNYDMVVNVTGIETDSIADFFVNLIRKKYQI